LTELCAIGWDAALSAAEAGNPRALADLVETGGPIDAAHVRRLAAFIRRTARSSKDTPLSMDAVFMIRDRHRTFRKLRDDLLKEARIARTAVARARLRAEARTYSVQALYAELKGRHVLDVHGRAVRLTCARIRDVIYGRS